MFTEIWLHDEEELPWIPGFDSYKAARPRSRVAAGFGGVAIYIKRELSEKTSVWRVREQDEVLWIRYQISASAPSQFFCCCYAAPAGSPGCPRDMDKWFENLENDISEARGLGEVLVAGDFNARIGVEPDFNRLDAVGTGTVFGWERKVLEEDLDYTCGARTSVDTTVTSRGLQLLNLCELTGMRVLNGRVAGDIPAAPTSLVKTGNGKAVIDLFLACPRVLEKAQLLRVAGKLTPAADHAAVTLTLAGPVAEVGKELELAGKDEISLISVSESNSEPEIIIDPLLLPAFVTAVAEAVPLLEQICTAANDAAESKDIAMLNRAVEDFNTLVRDACRKAGMEERKGNTDKNKWAARINKLPPAIRAQRRIVKRRHRRSVRACDAAVLAEQRRKLKELTVKARKERRAFGVQRLERLLKEDPREFYKRYRSAPSPTLVSHNDLSSHFEKLLGADPPDLPVPEIVPGTVPPAENLGGLQQTPFSVEEVSAALRKVRNGAAMLGILKPQLLKASLAQLGPAVVALLNASVAVGQLPKRWALSAITAIPKAGSDTKMCDGYRGIAVGTLAAKIYGAMLDARMSGWAEASELRAEGQFGFRRGKGTTSAQFILRTLIDQVKTQQDGRLYTCFVDFKKAYDSVPRHLLWIKLERRGVTGWVLDAIKTMYADVPMCLKSSMGLGKTFQSKLGVKQGCPLSPLLFGLYLDDWDDELRAAAAGVNSNDHGFDFPVLNGKDLRSLMYADDLAQAATSLSGLRKQMALLEDFSARWGLTINASKTKVMVFGLRRSLEKEEAARLYIGGEAVEVVESFKYLGTIFHCSHRLAASAVPTRAQNGRKAYHINRRRMAELGLHGPEINFRLFDVMVEPVLSYGAEIWAPELLLLNPLSNDCERTQLLALKWQFGLRRSAAGYIVLAEAGRWPLAFRWVKRLARFYNKLVRAPSDSLLKNALIANCQLTTCPVENSTIHAEKKSWAAQLQRAFSQWGVEISLEQPAELNVDEVCRKWLNWYLDMVRATKGTKIHKYVHEIRNGLPENEYLPSPCLAVPDFTRRLRLLQLRSGSHWLHEETGRWSNLEKEERVCKQCLDNGKKVCETVEHVIFDCPTYESTRAEFSCLDFTTNDINEFFKQSPTQLGSFAKQIFDLHREFNPPPKLATRRKRRSS